MNLGFGDCLFITVMTTFGLGFLWLGWLGRFLPIWIVPVIGIFIGFILLSGWWKRFKAEKEEAIREMRSMQKQGKGGNLGRA